jgi:circadian clock protein KaiC
VKEGVNMERVLTYIPKLDRLLGGGFIEKSVTVMSGPAGSGKTLIGMQFVYNGIKEFDDPGMFITIEEGSASVSNMMKSLKMDIDDYINEGKLYMVDLGEVGEKGESKDKAPQSFRELIEILNPLIKISGAKRLVLDSIPALAAYYKSSGVFRLSLFRLRRFLQANNITTILITESGEDGKPTRFGIEEYIADNFILLTESTSDTKSPHYLEIKKTRISDHDRERHSYHIGKKGITIT